MRRRPLGTSGIEVSEIGFGTWGLGGDARGTLGYGPVDDDESRRALAAALDCGCTFFDTANLYGWGHAESVLGKAIVDVRGRVVVATKAGYVTPDGRQDFGPRAVRESVEASLERLDTDHVDLVQLHNPPLDHAVVADALGSLGRLREAGRLRAIGISARTPDEALAFAQRHALDTLQVNFNLGDLRALRNGLFDACTARGIGLLTRSPLAAGFLTGTLSETDDFAATDHRRRFAADRRLSWRAAAERQQPVFSDERASPAQNAIRFCLSFAAVSTVVTGMMRVAEVHEDLAASRLARLRPRQIEDVESIYDRLDAGAVA